MRAIISRLHKKTIVEIFKNFAKNACVTFKHLLIQSNDRNSRARYEITVKTPDGSTFRTDFNSWFCVFIADFEQLIWAVSGFFEELLLVILDRYFVIFVILNFWVRTSKYRLLGKLEKIFHNCHNPLLTRVNIENLANGECLLANVYLTSLVYLDNLLQVTTFFFRCRELVFGFLNGKRKFLWCSYSWAIVVQ